MSRCFRIRSLNTNQTPVASSNQEPFNFSANQNELPKYEDIVNIRGQPQQLELNEMREPASSGANDNNTTQVDYNLPKYNELNRI